MASESSQSPIESRFTTIEPSVAILRDITRYVPQHVQCMLWGKAAGRCEFAGCNTPLWKSPVTQEQVNIAQKAHIYSFSSDGPRGNIGISRDQLRDIGNLILVDCRRVTITKLLASNLAWPPVAKSFSPNNSIPS
jgi:hypothetical protein